MPQPLICTRCEQRVSVMTRDVGTGLCPKCRAKDERAGQAATLAGIRDMEDAFFAALLNFVPERARAAVWGLLSHPRVRGLLKVIVGFGLAIPIYFLFDWLANVTGVAYCDAVVAFPLVVSFIGWIELLAGISFIDLSGRFDSGGRLVKTGISLAVLTLIAIYFAIGYYVYNNYL